MGTAILLAVAASLCTATASVCQRAGARNTGPAAGFDARLIVRLARQPAWLLGIAAMIGGFVFQLTALRFGELALVQPILAAELLFVFGYLAVAGSRRPKLRDWLAAAAMSAGIGLFLRLASPSGAIGLALLVLAWAERNRALLVFTLGYLVIVLVPITFGWVMPLSPWSFLPRLVIQGSVLLLGGIGFALAQRPARLPA